MPLGDAGEFMVGLTRDRTCTWALLAAVTARPTEGLVERLQGGELLDQLAASVAWLASDWRPPGLLVLRVLGRQVGRRGVPATLETMGDAWVAATPLISQLHAAVSGIAQQCADELEAWKRGDHMAAKAVRVEQMSGLVPDAPVRRLADALARRDLPVYAHVAQAVLAYVRLETGR